MEHSSVRLRRVRLAQPSFVLGNERCSLIVGQGLQYGPRACAGNPIEDRIRSGEYVQIGRLPRLDSATESRKIGEVVNRLGDRGPCHAPSGRREPRVGRQLAKQPMTRLIESARQLEGQPATLGEVAEE